MSRRNITRYTITQDDYPTNVEERDSRGKIIPKKRKKRTHQADPLPLANVVAPTASVFNANDIPMDPPERLQYAGDVTEEQVIANLNAMDIPVYGGKVKAALYLV